MMTDAPTGYSQSIVLQPHAGQLVIDELPVIVLCCTTWAYGSMEGLPLAALAVSVAALLSLALLYRFIYLRRTRYHIGSEQLISRHGVLSRKTDYIEQYRIADSVEYQSLMQQLCGLEMVRIFPMDRNTSRLDLVSIRHNFDVVTLVRERVEYNKRKRGIYEITNHQSGHFCPLPDATLGKSPNHSVQSIGMDGVGQGQRGYQ